MAILANFTKSTGSFPPFFFCLFNLLRMVRLLPLELLRETLRGTDCIAEARSPRSSSSEVLKKEIGSRGVTVNSILPTAIEGAGVYTEGASEDVMQFVRSFRPIRRMGTLDDVANAAEYLASDLAGFISGQHLLVSGGAPA